MKPYFYFVRWLHRFTEPPFAHPIFYPLAGLYECLWARQCGHDWAFARRMGLIYWWPKDRAEAPYEAILQSSDKMVLDEAIANGDDPAEIAKRMRATLDKAMAEADRRAQRTNAEILRDIMNDPNRKSVIHRHDDGTNRS